MTKTGQYEKALATIGRGYDMFASLPAIAFPDVAAKGRPHTNGNGHTPTGVKTRGKRQQQPTVGQQYTPAKKSGRKPQVAAPQPTRARGEVPTVPDRIAILMHGRDFRVADIIDPLKKKGWLPESKNLNNYLSFVLSSNKERFENISRGVYRVIEGGTPQGKGRRAASKRGGKHEATSAAGGPPVQDVDKELAELGIGEGSAKPNPFGTQASNEAQASNG